MSKKFLNKELVTVFSNLDYSYEDMCKLMKDTATGNLQEVSKEEAEEAIRNMMFEVLELEPEQLQNEKLFKRAMKHNKDKFFEVIEDVVEDMLQKGWDSNPFFMQYVETKNLADGDHNEFWTNEEVNLTVAEISGDHHDLFLQQLGEGESYSVKTSKYGAAVGMDIRLYLAGRKNFTELVNAITDAFDKKIKETIFTEVMGVGSKLPCQQDLNIATSLSEATKDKVDTLVELVSAANGNSDVIIMGAPSAIRKLEKLTNVDWVSDDMKNRKHVEGRLGYYEGTALIEIPQRVDKKADRLVTKIPTDKLLVLPVGMDKFVKFVNKGDAQIVEVNQIGARQDDLMTFEYQQGFGVGTQVGKYFGCITITA